VGALVALHRDAEEVRQMDNALGYACRATWSNSHHLGQLAVTELLTDPDLAARIATERHGLMELLQERVDAFNRQAREASLPTPRYDAGFFVTVFTPDQDVTAAAMRERGVYVVPIPGAVRIAICSTPAASVPRVVAAVQAGLAAAS
jgi:aspartate/tyrosine/aromatic aminotransferase